MGPGDNIFVVDRILFKFKDIMQRCVYQLSLKLRREDQKMERDGRLKPTLKNKKLFVTPCVLLYGLRSYRTKEGLSNLTS